MDINIYSHGTSLEESFGMGDEAPLEGSVAVDPYDTYPNGI